MNETTEQPKENSDPLDVSKMTVGAMEEIAAHTILACSAKVSNPAVIFGIAKAYRDMQIGIAVRKLNTITSPDGLKILAEIGKELADEYNAQKAGKATGGAQ